MNVCGLSLVVCGVWHVVSDGESSWPHYKLHTANRGHNAN